MDLQSKVYNCMTVFQTPYKAVLIALYEAAVQLDNSVLMNAVKKNFDIAAGDMAGRFIELGLDNTLVLPSYVVDVSTLQAKIICSEQERPELNYHKDNELFLNNIVKEIKLITGELYA